MVRLPLTPAEVERGQRLGALLRRARGERSMLDTALDARVSPETLRKIESGRVATPAFPTIAAIADVLGLSLDALWAEINLLRRRGPIRGIGPRPVGLLALRHRLGPAADRCLAGGCSPLRAGSGRYADRVEAGAVLAERLAEQLIATPPAPGLLVLGLPRGGIPVAARVAAGWTRRWTRCWCARWACRGNRSWRWARWRPWGPDRGGGQRPGAAPAPACRRRSSGPPVDVRARYSAAAGDPLPRDPGAAAAGRPAGGRGGRRIGDRSHHAGRGGRPAHRRHRPAGQPAAIRLQGERRQLNRRATASARATRSRSWATPGT